MSSTTNGGGIIRTVRGDVPASPWGWTNTHAHLQAITSSEFKDFPLYKQYATGGAIFEYSETFPDFAEFGLAGGFALVDTTPVGLGRDPTVLLEASEKTGVHIIMATGIYHDPLIPDTIKQMSDEEISRHFIKEITEGIADTDIKAGLIKVATYTGPMTDTEKKIFRAAAWASQETGFSITTHTYLGRNALDQVDILTAQGARPDQIVIGHLDDGDIDQDLIRAIVDRGANAQLDAIGCEYYTERLGSQMPTDKYRLETLMALNEAGAAKQMMIGSDLCLQRHLRKNGGPGYAHLVDGFLKLARELEVPESLLTQCMITNAADFLTLRPVEN